MLGLGFGNLAFDLLSSMADFSLHKVLVVLHDLLGFLGDLGVELALLQVGLPVSLVLLSISGLQLLYLVLVHHLLLLKSSGLEGGELET